MLLVQKLHDKDGIEEADGFEITMIYLWAATCSGSGSCSCRGGGGCSC